MLKWFLKVLVWVSELWWTFGADKKSCFCLFVYILFSTTYLLRFYSSTRISDKGFLQKIRERENAHHYTSQDISVFIYSRGTPHGTASRSIKWVPISELSFIMSHQICLVKRYILSPTFLRSSEGVNSWFDMNRWGFLAMKSLSQAMGLYLKEKVFRVLNFI